jgi:hypothetical protein
MPIDKLGSTSAIIAAMRAEMNRRTERTAGKDAKRTETPDMPAPVRGDVKVLRRQLAEIVQPVSIDDPEAVRAVRPQVVRAILLWEFGSQLREHPEWQPMLESITHTLEKHDPHQAQFLQLLTELKR